MESVELQRANGGYCLTVEIGSAHEKGAWHVRVVGRDKHKIKTDLMPGGATERETDVLAEALIAKYKTDGWVEDFEDLPAADRERIRQRVDKFMAREAKRMAKKAPTPSWPRYVPPVGRMTGVVHSMYSSNAAIMPGMSCCANAA